MKRNTKKNKRILSFVLFALLVLNMMVIGVSASESGSSDAYIPQEAYTYGGHSYMFYSGSLTWDQAVEYCEEVGGHLVTITSEGEWAFIQEKAKQEGGHFWLGATDKNYKGDWRWITGESWSFTAWSNEYPNSDSNADYLYISSTRDYMWYNWAEEMDNNAKEGFVCEWDYCCKSENGYFTSHDWSEWVTTQETTCDAPGAKNRTCKECGATETQVIEQLTHIYGDLSVVSGSKLIPPIVKERQCSLCGDVDQVKDWSFVWVPIVCGVVALFAIFGVINYVRILKKGKNK